MKNLLSYLVIIILLQSCQLGSQGSNGTTGDSDKSQYVLVWQDEFNYSGLPDSTKWGYDTEGNDAGWGNEELQFYTTGEKKNAWVENGKLQVTAHKEKVEGKEFSSVRLISLADWKYGKIEVNAKVPSANGTWSAIWMMPGGWSFNDGNWPNIGEFDIMEHVGHNLGVVHSTVHCKDYNGMHHTQKTAIISIPDVAEDFHSYRLEWTPDVLKTFVDDSLFFEYHNEGLGKSSWPYNKPFYLILNVAVGGAWGDIKGIDEEAFPQTMEVDYVRVYQKNEELEKQ